MDSNKPLISIIMPTMNSESWIGKSLKSLLDQTLKNWELIIIDGGSKDATYQIVKDLIDPRIYFFSYPKSGIYESMNLGIKLSHGSWLYFLGSDDLLFDNHVLTDMSKLMNYEKYNFIYGNVAILGQVKWAKGQKIYGGRFTLYKLLRRNICHQSIFYRRKFLSDNGLEFCTDYFISADWDLNIRCFLLTKPKFHHRIIALFKDGGESSLRDDQFHLKIPFLYKKYWENPFLTQPHRLLFHFYRWMTRVRSNV